VSAATQSPNRVTLPPARAVRFALAVFVLVNLAIVEGLYLTAAPPASNTLTAIGRFLGLHLAFLLALHLLLISRLPLLDRWIGLDRLTVWHRWTGFTIFWLVLLHPAFVMLGYSRLDRVPFLAEFPALAAQAPVLLGMVAAGLVIVVAALSVRMVRRRLSYEVWHGLHMLTYVVIVCAIVHQLFEGSAFTTNLLTEVYWWGLWAFALGSLLTFRLIVPIVRNARHRLQVAAVVAEAGDVVSVYTTGRRLDRLPARAGQFFVWRFPGANGWWQANPFSLSAAPDGRTLRLTAKAVGATSAGLRALPVGTRVFAEGPYGALTAEHRTRPSALMIAGGIGVTPIRALLEDPTLTGDIVVLYRVRDEAEAVLFGEMRNLAATRGARLLLLTGRTGPANQPFAAGNLSRLVPDIADRDVYLCGPTGMARAVLTALRELRVPTTQIHAELFRLAG
jgi:predicted ferric reductase